MSAAALVLTSCGQVRGLWKTSSEGKQFLAFRGIPYAEAPVKKRRWRLPEPIIWNGIFEAFRCGPDCPQLDPLSRYCSTFTYFRGGGAGCAMNPCPLIF